MRNLGSKAIETTLHMQHITAGTVIDQIGMRPLSPFIGRPSTNVAYATHWGRMLHGRSDDQFGNPTDWTIREDTGVLWIRKDHGPALIAHDSYVQIIRSFDGRISIRLAH